MKKSAGSLLAVLSLCAAFGWWGILYPQLTMTPDTYRVVSEDGTVQEDEPVVEWDFDGDIYTEILGADPGRVRFRSGLWKSLRECLEYWKKE